MNPLNDDDELLMELSFAVADMTMTEAVWKQQMDDIRRQLDEAATQREEPR